VSASQGSNIDFCFCGLGVFLLLCLNAEISVTGQQHSRQMCPSTFIIVTYYEAVVKTVLRHLLASSRTQMDLFYLLLYLNISVPDSYSLHFHNADRSILSIKEASETSHYFRNTVLSTESRSQVQTLSDLSSTVE